MSILYVKYSSHRAPKYRIRTMIEEENRTKRVRKYPENEESIPHLRNIATNYELAKKAYGGRVIPVPVELSEDVLTFPFVLGKPITGDIDFDKDSMEVIREKVGKILDIVICPENLDPIMSNFIMGEDGSVYLFDYEWMDPDGVDPDYLRYRSVFYLYREEYPALSVRISQEEFLELFGFTKNDIHVFTAMEDNFQNRVHGPQRKYITLPNFQKGIQDVREDLFTYKGKIRDLENNLRVSGESGNEQRIWRELFLREAESAYSILNSRKGYLAAKLRGELPVDWGQRANSSYQKRDELYKQATAQFDYWIKNVEAGYEEPVALEYNPKISVIMPVYNIDSGYLTGAIESVLAQTYTEWELIIVDDGSNDDVKSTLNKYTDSVYHKIHIITRDINGGISAAQNTGLTQAKGEFVAFLDCDDLLAPRALYEVAKKLNENRILDIIYSDEDKTDHTGLRFDPFFKPAYSPDTLMSMNYFCHLLVVRRLLVEELGFRSEYDGVQDYDFLLRATEKTKNIGHIPRILYHWRVSDTSTAGGLSAKPYTLMRGIRSKEEALKRRGLLGYAQEVPGTGYSRVIYEGSGHVSVVIPSKDHPEVLERCLSSFAKYTLYSQAECIIVDNGSSPENKAKYEGICEKFNANYIFEPAEFNFSKMCNRGAREAKGEFVLFLNDDTEIIEPNWLCRMVGQCSVPGTGAVGAKLFYPGLTDIQHDGIAIIAPGPANVGNLPEGTFARNDLDFNVIAVTGACLLIRTEVFREVGGFNEDFPVAYNDVELCFKVHKKGYNNVIRNDAVLIHHESVSRGLDAVESKKRDRLIADRERLINMYPEYMSADPYYNTNLNMDAADYTVYYDKGYDFSLKSAPDYPMGEEGAYICNFDNVVIDWKIHIFGWVFFREGNTMEPPVLMIENGNNRFFVPSKKYYRPDVFSAHPEIPFSEFSGFRTKGDRSMVPPGTYSLYFIHNDKKYLTGEELVF